MKSLFILLIAFTSVAATVQSFSFGKNQYLNGVVTESGTNTPLAGVSVKISAKGKTIATSITQKDGIYNISVPTGKYDAEFILATYETNRAIGIQIEKDKKTRCDIALKKASLSGQSVTWQWSPGRLSDDVESEILSDIEAGSVSMEETVARPTTTPTTAPAGRAEPVPVKTIALDAIADVPPPSPATPADASGVATRTTPVSSDVRKSSVALKSGESAKKYDAVDRKPSSEATAFSVPLIKEDKARELPKTTLDRPAQPNPRAGLLTAGEWNDLDNWAKHWTDLLHDGEIDAYQSAYGFYPKSRYSVLLTNYDDFPVIDAQITLTNSKGETIWEGRTDNTGKAELWYGLFDKNQQAPELSVYATIDGKKQTLGKVKPIESGLNRFTINRKCQSSQKVDIVWAVDATGSMGDEIEYLKTELLDVIGRVKNINPGLSMRMGSVFYKDVTDEYLVKSSGLSPDISKTVDYIRQQFAGGGGDYPEAVHSALEEAIYRQDWSADAVARICFLVLDASPHQDPEVIASIQRSIKDAAKKGIRVVPVSASGIQKDTEFLMKFFGLATNGTYLFLTDHSGIGGKHIEATTDEYKVELLNNLLVRIISQYTSVSSCDGKSQVIFESFPTDSLQQQVPSQAATYYPNPAVNYVTLDLPFDAQKVTLYNAEGSAVYSLSQTTTGRHTIPVTDLPAGYYSIRIWKDNQTQSGKILVIKT